MGNRIVFRRATTIPNGEVLESGEAIWDGDKNRLGIGISGTRDILWLPSINKEGDLHISEHSHSNGRIRLGNYYIWIDEDGKLRIKNGFPTSDIDGTIVGTQS